MLLFAVIMAFCIAKLEINVEGKHGWARDLPTYRFSNWFTKFFMGRTKLTGYHVWLNATVFAFVQFPFFIGYPWSFKFELLVLSVLIVGIVFEDFFWFIFNPAYGLSRFNKKDAPWHHWLGPIPAMYIVCLSISLVLILLSR